MKFNYTIFGGGGGNKRRLEIYVHVLLDECIHHPSFMLLPQTEEFLWKPMIRVISIVRLKSSKYFFCVHVCKFSSRTELLH